MKIEAEKIMEIISLTLSEQLSINELIDKDSKLFDLGIDSIGFMVLVVCLENSLDLEIDIEAILNKDYNLITIEDLINSILRYK